MKTSMSQQQQHTPKQQRGASSFLLRRLRKIVIYKAKWSSRCFSSYRFSTHMHYTSTNYTVTPTMPVNDNEISIQRNATPTVPAEGGSNEISTQQISPPSSLSVSTNLSAFNGVVIFDEVASPSLATLLAIDHLLSRMVVRTNNQSSDHCPQLRLFRCVEYQTRGNPHNHICIAIPSSTSSVLNVHFQTYVQKNRDEQ